MTIKLQDIYGLAKVKIGDLFSNPPAGTSQSIIAADPADTPLELTPAAAQTAALLRANGKDVIDKNGDIVVASDWGTTHQIVNLPYTTIPAAPPAVAGTWHNVPLPAGTETALSEGVYLLLVNGSLGAGNGAPVTTAAPTLRFNPVPNTTLTQQTKQINISNAKNFVMTFSYVEYFKVTMGTTANFSFPGYIEATQGGANNIDGIIAILDIRAILLSHH